MSDDLWGETLGGETEYARVCYYGDPGTGKTTAAAELARLGRTLYYRVEPGLKGVALEQRGVPIDNIIPATRNTPADMMEAFWKIKGDPAKYDFTGIVVDSLTELTRQVRRRLLTETYESEVKKAEAKGLEYTKPANWMPLEKYGELAEEIGEVISSFHDLPLHLAFCAHERRDVDEKDGEVKYGPATTPAVQQVITGYVDVLMWVRRVGTYPDGRPIIVGVTDDPGGKRQVKDRLGVLPRPSMVYPSMDRIVAYANGDLTPKNDKLQQEFLTWKSDLAKAKRKEG